MRTKYVVEADEEDGWNDTGATVYQIDPDGTKTAIGWIGGEPEDNVHYRTYSWIVGALNTAYLKGMADGADREYNRLRDKI